MNSLCNTVGILLQQIGVIITSSHIISIYLSIYLSLLPLPSMMRKGTAGPSELLAFVGLPPGSRRLPKDCPAMNNVGPVVKNLTHKDHLNKVTITNNLAPQINAPCTGSPRASQTNDFNSAEADHCHIDGLNVWNELNKKYGNIRQH